jgi:hypothetical protein
VRARDLARYEIAVPALAAGIRVLKAAPKNKDVDRPNKSGHDELWISN